MALVGFVPRGDMLGHNEAKSGSAFAGQLLEAARFGYERSLPERGWRAEGQCCDDGSACHDGDDREDREAAG